jgi:hypothetical protein
MTIDYALMLWIILVTAGISFVITGSTIAYPIRLVAFHTIGKLRIGPIHFDSLFRCPFCNAWWVSFGLSFLIQLPWWQALANAFVACLIMGVAQAQWHLAADDGFEDKPKDKAVYTFNSEVMRESSNETIRESTR